MSVMLPAIILGIPALAMVFVMFCALGLLAVGVFWGVMCIHDGIMSGGGYLGVFLAVPVVVFIIVRAIMRAAFSASAVIWWARGGSMLLVAAMAVYYIHLWDAGGTSKAWWADHLG